MKKVERKVLFTYEDPITIGQHKVKKIKQVPKGIRFKTEDGPVLVEVEAKETWTEEELHGLLTNK
jgi:hypothetical protein